MNALRVIRRRPEGAPEVEEVVLDEAPPALLAVAVDRVDRARVEHRQPGEQHPARAQRTPVLVRDPVVRIARADAEHVEPAQDGPRNPRHRGRPDAVTVGPRRLRQGRPHQRLGQRALLHAVELEARAGIDLEIAGADVDQECARDVVAGRVKDAAADHLARVRHAQVPGDVELEHELAAVGVLDLESGGRPQVLPLGDLERRPRRRRRGPRDDLGDGQRAQVVARAEPGRARHLVERVDVTGRGHALEREHAIRLVRQRVADDQGDHHLLEVVALRRRGNVRVVVFVPGDRPIREPARRIVARGRGAGERREERARRGQPARARTDARCANHGMPRGIASERPDRDARISGREACAARNSCVGRARKNAIISPA